MPSPSIKEERRKKTMREAKENKGQDGGERSKKTEKPQRSGREGIKLWAASKDQVETWME